MKCLLLISGGIDSPVAGYIMLNKGVELVAIHFDNQPFTDNKHVNKAKELIKLLEKITKKKIPMYIIDHGLNQKELITNCNRRYGCILCRRLMFKISEEIAKQEKCEFLVTGENLSQVASQTLSNLTISNRAVKIPILRPLLCNDKEETIQLSKKIGIFETSILPGVCCNAVPKNPATRSEIDVIEAEEKKINVDKLIKQAVEGSKIVN